MPPSAGAFSDLCIQYSCLGETSTLPMFLIVLALGELGLDKVFVWLKEKRQRQRRNTGISPLRTDDKTVRCFEMTFVWVGLRTNNGNGNGNGKRVRWRWPGLRRRDGGGPARIFLL